MFSRVTECSIGLNYPYTFIHKIISLSSVSVCEGEWRSERTYTRLTILASEAEVGLKFLSFPLWTTGSHIFGSLHLFLFCVLSIVLVKDNKDLEDRNPMKKLCKGDEVMNKSEVTEGPSIVKYHLSLFLDIQA